MPHRSSDAVAAAMLASHRYDDAASLSSRHVPAPAGADSESVSRLSVQFLPVCKAHIYTVHCLSLSASNSNVAKYTMQKM